MAGEKFRIVIQGDYFCKSDIFEIEDLNVKVTSTPKMHLWQRFKKLIGLNYSWHYTVRLLTDKEKIEYGK